MDTVGEGETSCCGHCRGGETSCCGHCRGGGD